MRKPLFLLLTFAIVLTTARAVSASTDCQRWLADYKNALAQKADAQKLLAAKRRARAYLHRKVAQLTTAAPAKPHPTRVSSTRPHLTPAQMLKRFDVLCGDLPEEPAPQVLDARMTPDDLISEMSTGEPVDVGATPGDTTLIASDGAPAYDGPGASPQTPGNATPYTPIYAPVYGGGVPPAPAPPIIPVAPVPEPGSLLLLLTGGVGALGTLRRRLSPR